MKLHFILGGSGRGKSYEINHRIVKMSKEHPERLFFLVVPEQATMQTQREIVQISEEKGMMNIEVQSFVRLAFRVFAETGTANLPVLDDMGKTMILHKVLAQKEKELTYFGRNVHKKGYVAQIKSFLSEMMQYGMDEDALQEMIKTAKGKGALQKKLADMQIAYRSFREYLENHYITSEEVLGVFSSVVSQSRLLKDSVICLDGFTGFTPVQYQLIDELMKCCSDIYVTVTLGEGEVLYSPGEKHELYHMSRKTTTKFLHLNQENHLEEPEIIWLDGSRTRQQTRFADSPGIDHLERHLFRYPGRRFDSRLSDISIHVLKQPQQEMDFVIEKTLELVRDGVRYRDIAVVAGDMEVYGTLAKGAFVRAGIPCFIDQKKSILSHPFVSMVEALLEVLLTDFAYEPVMRFLRGKYSPLKREQVDLLDNYLLATGIRGHKKWMQEWKSSYAFRIQDEERKEQITVQLNESREMVWETFRVIYEMLGRRIHKVREFATALVEFMERQAYYHQIMADVEIFWKRDMELAREYEQVYEIVLGVLDRLVELLGDESVPLKEFKELLDTGFTEARVGLIPPGVDQVLIGDLTRTRLDHIQHLFFLGMTDANIPKGSGSGGVLSASERSFLEQQDFELAPTEREQVYTEQFYLYLTLTKPEKHLYLCLCEIGNDGKAQNPSYLVERIEKMFPEMEIRVEERCQEDVHILGSDKGMGYLIRGFENKTFQDAKWQEILRYYIEDSGRRKYLEPIMDAAFYFHPKTRLQKEAAKKLYQDILWGSASKFELYASCAYRYFLKYGLRLTEREERAVEFYDIGNIIHGALELYTKDIIEQNVRWQDISEEEQRRRARKCFDEVIEGYKDGLLLESFRNRNMMGRLQRILFRTIRTITGQMEQGSFQTVGSELKFEQVHGPLRLVGSVDRMDLIQTDDADYITVVDYKTGAKEVSLSDLYYGLQMQLVIYMQAAVEEAGRQHRSRHIRKKIIPAGIFYFHPDDPMLEGAVPEENVDHEIMKQLRLRGLFNEEDEVLYALDRKLKPDSGNGLAASVRSDVAHIVTKKDGTLSSQSSGAVTPEDFASLMTHVSGKLREMSREILDGKIEIAPYRKENGQEACDYCPYHAVCRFDARLAGQEYRDLKELSAQEVLEKISRETHK